MTRSRLPSWVRGLGVGLLLAAVLAVLRPWTVRPLHTPPAAAFDAGAFAAQAWPRLVEEASRSAVDAAAVRGLRAQPAAPGAAGGEAVTRKAAFVTFTGVVAQIDRRSRVGLARLRPDAAAGEVAIQIGPVIRGTAVRDATTFIRFGDFANQFEFAAVANALHERVLRDVVGGVDLDRLVGQPVTVLGAAALAPPTAAGAPLDVVPIRLQPAGGVR
jgi:predicted lipoprotein